MAGVLRLTVNQGETYSLTAQWLAGGVPVDLTGAVVRMQLREKPGSTALVTFSSAGTGITLTPLTGTIVVSIPAATSAAWTFTHVVYDILVTMPNTTTKRLMEGDMYISPQVTVP